MITLNSKKFLSSMSNKSVLIKSLIITLLIFLLLVRLYCPIYEENDDVALAMLIHGFGIADQASIYVARGNVLYGVLLNHLPTIFGILPYFYMTFVALFLFSWISLYCFYKLEVNRLQAILIVGLILIKPFSMPQYTMNAGLLAITCILTFLVFQQTKKNVFLYLTGLFFLYSFSVRNYEPIFVILVALPIFVNNKFYNKKNCIALTFLAALFLLAIALNDVAIHAFKLQYFESFKDIIENFTGYGAISFFQNHPALLPKHGYTSNDIGLLMYDWFDPGIANIGKMKELLMDWPLNGRIFHNLLLGWQAIKTVGSEFFYMDMLAVIFFLLHRQKVRILACWVVFLSIIFLIGVLGRPSVTRIYYPIIVLLMILPVINKPIALPIKSSNLFVNVIITIIFVISIISNYKINQERLVIVHLAKKDIKQLTENTLYVVWGSSLPYQYIYLPLSPIKEHYKWYAFSWAYFFPTSITYQLDTQKKGMMFWLAQSQPFQSLVSEENTDTSLDTYCKEHLHKKLHIIANTKFTYYHLQTMQCI